MSDIPANLRYTKTHEWVERSEDGSLRIGITDHAQDLLGDMVYIELPEVGAELDVGEECTVVESVKAASDVFSPIAGEVISVNEALEDSPEDVNKSPYGDGWLFQIQPSDEAAFDTLLDANEYAELAAAEAH